MSRVHLTINIPISDFCLGEVTETKQLEESNMNCRIDSGDNQHIATTSAPSPIDQLAQIPQLRPAAEGEFSHNGWRMHTRAFYTPIP